MSRGLGKRQQAILAAVDALGGAASVLELARYVERECVAVGGSAYESTRRAVQTLVARGMLRPFEWGGRAIRYAVRYSDGIATAHKRFARPDTVAAWGRDQTERAGGLHREIPSFQHKQRPAGSYKKIVFPTVKPTTY